MLNMRRRQFITLLGGAAAWPVAVQAQPPAMPLIGFLRSTSLADATHLVTGFRQGLKEAGFVEGQNVTVEYHSAEGHNDRLPALVADLIRRQVAVIVGNSIAALTAKAATTTVPIVFGIGEDPVNYGLVAAFNRPGGNVTGVVFFAALAAKRLELLRELVPKATTIALLVSPDPDNEAERRDIEAAAHAVLRNRPPERFNIEEKQLVGAFEPLSLGQVSVGGPVIWALAALKEIPSELFAVGYISLRDWPARIDN
jgi:putative ABC transport system substrate-binding protein